MPKIKVGDVVMVNEYADASVLGTDLYVGRWGEVDYCYPEEGNCDVKFDYRGYDVEVFDYYELTPLGVSVVG